MADPFSHYAQWWVRGEGPMSAAEVLEGVESGRWSLSDPVSARPNGRPRQLRRWLRELVLSSYVGSELDEHSDVYQVAFERAQVGLVVSDVRGQLLAVNQAFANLLGYEVDELKGTWVKDLSGPDPEGRERRLASDVLAGRSKGYTLEKTLRHRDGHLVSVLVTVGLSVSERGVPAHVVGSVLDLRRHRAEEARERAEENLRSMQLLARGVAHDVSNLLTAIRASAEGLREDRVELRDDEDLETIDMASHTLTRLVSQLKRLAVSGRGGAEPCEMVQWLQTRLPLFGRLMGPGQKVVLEAPEEEVVVHIEPAGLEQVVLNLVVNASQAMEGRGGTVTLRVRLSDDGVELTVEDEGVGMPEVVRRRAMEPFFTTKATGSGLGLAIVNAVLVRSSARLEIEPGPERGTIMRVVFPRSVPSPMSQVPTVPRDAPPSEPVPASGALVAARTATLATARILLVDDDPLIRRVFGRVLGRAVADVTVASDGVEALSWMQGAAARPDVVVTDFAMPNMNGVELARAIADGWPDVPVVMITAYKPTGLERLLDSGVLREVLSKPVELPTIVAALERALVAATPTETSKTG